MTDLNKRRRLLDERESRTLSTYAVLSRNAARRRPEERVDKGHRQGFSVDSDRILHSASYTRYIDKTQVFSLIANDHITHRVLHVQLVSKIARTIGRLLGLNEDLIEAIALGHDIGHCPFGHDGESFLSALCIKYGIGRFLHNIQSVRFLDMIEKGGTGLNLSLQTLDGIAAHDGEVHTGMLKPAADKTFKTFDAELSEKLERPDMDIVPMTLEGCVVRIADTISYVGRDIEDAILLGVIRRSDIPEGIASVLGRTNGTIVYNLVEDLVKNSEGKSYAGFCEKVSVALKALKEFNLNHIYLNPKIHPDSDKIANLFKVLFEVCMDDLDREREDSGIIRDFLSQMDYAYRERTSPPEVVRDYIAGMTDDYFMRRCEQILLPKRRGPKL